MLKRKKINITCPIRLIHGLIDSVVPFNISIKFAQIVESQDVKLYLPLFLIKNIFIYFKSIIRSFITFSSIFKLFDLVRS